MNSRGISTVSVCAADPQKLRRSATHSSLLTSASASEKVGWDFSYHAVLRTLAAPSPLATYRWARRVTTEKSASIAGAVRPIALSDQCFWVSNPSCWRASQKVASICHLFTKWVIIRSGAAPDRYTEEPGSRSGLRDRASEPNALARRALPSCTREPCS